MPWLLSHDRTTRRSRGWKPKGLSPFSSLLLNKHDLFEQGAHICTLRIALETACQLRVGIKEAALVEIPHLRTVLRATKLRRKPTQEAGQVLHITD